MMRKILLTCGILSSLLYIAMNIFVPMLYEGYNSTTQTVSELSAIGAPTRPLWVVLGIVYSLLVAAFGLGIRQSASQNRSLRILGTLMAVWGIIGLAWSPMHQREVIAAGGGTFTDTWHIAMSMITLIFMILMMGYGAAALGKRFRLYSIASIVIFILFGILIGRKAPGISTNQPTPMIGVWERINISTFLVWSITLGTLLLRRKESKGVAAIYINNQRRKRPAVRKHQSEFEQMF